MAQNTTKALRNQVIYSIWVRNYSEEGTFLAVERDLARIRSLGVDIIWLLPIHPIGTDKRKGTLGSPYAIRDYRAVNPEFGTMADFVHLVDAIHAHGMKCMMDVVYNHTSPDARLVEEHSEYYYRKADGSMGNRIGDWTDIVDLSYHDHNLWDYQIETLQMWAKIVDGFRCDVAPLVPLAFWQEARKRVAEVNPDCIWLCESVEPEFTLWTRSHGIESLSDAELYGAFDMAYDYDIFKFYHGYLKGENSLAAYAAAINQQEHIYPANYVKLRFLENHDQDRAAKWIPDADKLANWTAFSYFQKGATLVYAGQENQNSHRPSLFEKDVICMDGKKDISDLLARLYAIKHLPTMSDSSYHVQAFGDTCIAEHRAVHGEERLVGVFRFGEAEMVKVPLQDGNYVNLVDRSTVQIRDGMLDNSLCPIIIADRKEEN